MVGIVYDANPHSQHTYLDLDHWVNTQLFVLLVNVARAELWPVVDGSRFYEQCYNNQSFI